MYLGPSLQKTQVNMMGKYFSIHTSSLYHYILWLVLGEAGALCYSEQTSIRTLGQAIVLGTCKLHTEKPQQLLLCCTSVPPRQSSPVFVPAEEQACLEEPCVATVVTPAWCYYSVFLCLGVNYCAVWEVDPRSPLSSVCLYQHRSHWRGERKAQWMHQTSMLDRLPQYDDCCQLWGSFKELLTHCCFDFLSLAF